MGRYSNWTMVCETFPSAATSDSVYLRVICTELLKVSMQAQLLIRPNPAALARASDYENVFSLFHKFKERASKHKAWIHNVKCLTGGIWNCKNLTEKSCDFIGLLLLNFLIIQSFKEDVQHQYIFSAEGTDKSTSNGFYVLWYHITSNDISFFLNLLSFIIVTLKVNDGDSGHAMPQCIHLSTERRKEAIIYITDWC